jgi:hypothetical protein
LPSFVQKILQAEENKGIELSGDRSGGAALAFSLYGFLTKGSGVPQILFLTI